MILSAMLGACTLIIAISSWAALLPALSIMSAALRQRSRVISMSMRARAIRSSHTLWSDTRLPKATRDWSRLAIASIASSATPIVRMQWWMRPGPRRPCAISNPRPSPSSTFSTGTRTSSSTTSPWPCGA